MCQAGIIIDMIWPVIIWPVFLQQSGLLALRFDVFAQLSFFADFSAESFGYFLISLATVYIGLWFSECTHLIRPNAWQIFLVNTVALLDEVSAFLRQSLIALRLISRIETEIFSGLLIQACPR